MSRFFAIAICLALVACNSSNSSPSPTPSPSAQLANVSGDYTGTMTDAQGGAGTVTATFAQHGSSAGGAMIDKEPSQTISPAISMAITATNSVAGAMVVDYASGATCTFTMTGTYSSAGASPTLSGSYTAVTGCAGDTGTFSLAQQCIDTVTASERRAQAVPAQC